MQEQADKAEGWVISHEYPLWIWSLWHSRKA